MIIELLQVLRFPVRIFYVKVIRIIGVLHAALFDSHIVLFIIKEQKLTPLKYS